MVLIKTDNLCKTYGNNENFVKAVDNITEREW